MDLCGLRPSPDELPAHLCPPCRNQYTPIQTHSAECPWVEVRGIEPLSRTPPDCRNYNHALNYGGGQWVFQGRRRFRFWPKFAGDPGASLCFYGRSLAGSGIPIGAEQAFAVAGDQVDFEIDLGARVQAVERGVFQRVRDQVDREVGAVDSVGGQAGAIDHDRTLARYVFGDLARGSDFQQAVVADRVEAQHFADAVDMAGDQVAADHVGQFQRLFQVDRPGFGQADRAGQGFRRDVDAEGAAFLGDDGQAEAVVGDRVAERNVVDVQPTGLDMQAKTGFAGGELADAADRRDDSRKHGRPCKAQKPDFSTPRRAGLPAQPQSASLRRTSAPALVVLAATRFALAALQIGRASCRER